MSKKNILIVSAIVFVIAILFVVFFVFGNKDSEGTNSTNSTSSDADSQIKTEVITESDDGNWTSIYEASSVN